MKKYNFNAGPSILPREVIENTAKQILDSVSYTHLTLPTNREV